MRLVAYDNCDELLDGLRTATAKRVTPYGLDGPTFLQKVPDGATPEAADGRASKGAQPQERSGTNVHEAAADEPDLVKTDGRRIVVISRDKLQVIDPATRKVVHRLELSVRGPGMYPGGGDSQLFLSGDRALVMSRDSPMGIDAMERTDMRTDIAKPVRTRPQTRLTLVDLAGTPKVLGSMTSETEFVDARQTGSVARIVVKSRPRIDFPVEPHGVQQEQKALERNRQLVQKAPLSAWLPKFEVRNGAETKAYTMPCGQVSRPASYTGTTMLSVLTVDLGKALGDPDPAGVVADGQTVYGTGASLYVTGTPPQAVGWGKVAPKPVEARTDIHKFDVRGQGRPRYVASGSVQGDLLNQYSMSEHDGHLRIATTTTPMAAPDAPATSTAAPRSESAVRVLEQRGAKLTMIGELGELGKGERIYSVRFIGPKAYVVTFRQVDPLYVLDLSDPTRLRSTGELKITGYSAYLHPTADGRLLGVGQDADAKGRTLGTQVSLFDVAGAPKRVDAFKLPESSAATEFDPHAFLYWAKSGLTVIPVSRHTSGGGEALVLKIGAQGIDRMGTVRHPSTGFEVPVQILRSLVVGDTLWTISSEGARATSATTLDDQGWLRF
ncbi:beta-propeller domain-containing protein [Spirillospora sp. NPDC048911]|uniref:beta-propeller domain-containing protein n=1 Tax=Spirillospora sp. NPDC048911 TaxID=3364527 RepID=UPI0037221CE2